MFGWLFLGTTNFGGQKLGGFNHIEGHKFWVYNNVGGQYFIAVNKIMGQNVGGHSRNSEGESMADQKVSKTK